MPPFLVSHPVVRGLQPAAFPFATRCFRTEVQKRDYMQTLAPSQSTKQAAGLQIKQLYTAFRVSTPPALSVSHLSKQAVSPLVQLP